MNKTLECSITYGHGLYKQQNTTGVSDTVVVKINTTQLFQLPSSHRQFTVIATDGTSIAHLKGTFNTTGGGNKE